MESESSSAQNGRTTWIPPMDQLFIELMVEQVLNKELLDGQFSKSAWENIVTKFKDSFGPSYNKEVLRNRMKTLRKSFNIVKHPEYKQWRTKPLPHYDDLAMIFGNSRATGKHSRFRDDNNQDNHEDDEDEGNNTQEQNENAEYQNDNTYGNGNISDDDTSEIQKKMRTSLGFTSRSFSDDSILSGSAHVDEILNGHDVRCQNSFRMEKHVFLLLCELLQEKQLLRHNKGVRVEEKVAIFMLAIGHNERNRILQERFQHSGETISRHFNAVLDAIVQLVDDFLQPAGSSTPDEIRENPRFIHILRYMIFIVISNLKLILFYGTLRSIFIFRCNEPIN
ncbi:hypothetical protein MKX03_012453 [Papaver bracteatum]|nr:hypothetical protein MKX03_012453 [Papaver bracteatum]